jgi:glyoxylase-like metal-dependent hydrolase (beta-lactamase superfamily II)
MKIQQISGNTWCLMGHQLIPMYMTDPNHCILMDTGVEGMREQIVQTLDEADITPIGLLCTHTHFDHFGNAKYLSQRYHCPVALPLGEAEICRTLASVKSHLFVFSAGQIANDPKMAAIPCVVDHVIRPEETETFFRGVRFRVLHTPGHSMDHVSYITPDGVCYGGDALMCGRSLAVCKLPYAFNFRQSIDTLELFRNLDCSSMILAHSGIVEAPFDDLVDENRRVMLDQLDQVRSMVDHPMSAEEICRAVCENMGVQVSTPEKAQNLERFLRPYMECMVDDGTHEMVIVNSTLCYAPVSTQEADHA